MLSVVIVVFSGQVDLQTQTLPEPRWPHPRSVARRSGGPLTWGYQRKPGLLHHPRGHNPFAARQRCAPPDTLATSVRTAARIGGHIHRTRGPPLGTKAIWRGHATLVEWCIGHELMLEQET